MPSPRFLILRGGAIGDFVVTLPVLQALRARWPDAHVELIGYPHIARLAAAAGLVAKVHALDTARIARFFGQRPEIDDATIAFLSSFDVVLSFLHDPDGFVGSNLRLHGAKELLYRSPVDPAGHIVDHLLKPLETLALFESGATPSLRLGDAETAAGRAWLDAAGAGPAPLAIHPGSGSPKKNWPVERFLEVARRVAADGRRPVFVLGEADHAIAGCVRSAAAELAAPVAEGLDLVALAGVLAGCGGYLGNDSGITHIAAALGIPVVTLFGPTDPTRWAPRGPNVRLLRAPGGSLEAIATADVLAAADSL
jgi:heptosyltransferase-2